MEPKRFKNKIYFLYRDILGLIELIKQANDKILETIKY